MVLPKKVDKKHPWRICVHAKARNFNFKFTASKISPAATKIFSTWMLYPFSVMLKFPHCLLIVKWESGSSISIQSGRTLKSKFLQILKKIPTLPAKNIATSAKNTSNHRNPDIKSIVHQMRKSSYEGPICFNSLVVGILAFLARSNSQKDRKALIIPCSNMFEFLAPFFKKLIAGKNNLFLIIIVATMACSILFYFSDLLNCDEDYISEYVLAAWNYAASSGCF